MKALPVVALVLLAACGDGDDVAVRRPVGTPEELAAGLATAAVELAARAEHGAEEVTIQHLLVAVEGADAGATRTPEEAQALAAEILARARTGEDFDLLVKNHTDDEYPGIYVLATVASDSTRVARSTLSPSLLGDAAWRLEVGEVGVVPFDAAGEHGSTLGYHLLERLK